MYRPRVFKQKGSRVYRGRFRLSSGRKIFDVPLDTPIKHVAEAKLAKLVREREEEMAGLIAPKIIRDAAQRPLIDHLEDFLSDLEARARCKDHRIHVEGRMLRLIQDCGWRTIGDISAESFIAWRAAQKNFTPKTCNEYLGHARALLNWLERQGRLAFNPLRNVPRSETRGKQSYGRRALTIQEVEKLAAVNARFGIIYRMAAYTGLRRGELRRLLWADVHLDVPRPFVEVRASSSKNKKDDLIPLIPCLVDELRARQAKGMHRSGRVFAQGIPHMKTLVKDLGFCGIPYKDARGYRVDFHALRHTFATLLATAGVSELLRVKLARHSEWRQTNRYTDPHTLPMFAEMNKLAALLPSPGASPKSDLSCQNVAESGQTGKKDAPKPLAEVFEIEGVCPQ